jgi:ABC-type transport system involved in multi-copper enzyme maturation permease subunit
MINLIKNETFKVFRLKKLYIFMAIGFVLLIINCIEFLVLKSFSEQVPPGLIDMLSNLSGQSFPMMMLPGLAQLIIIFMAILLADIISDEYKNGTLKLSLLRQVSRADLLISKIVAMFITVAVFLGFTMIVSYIAGTLFFGWGDKTVINNETFETGKGLILTFQSYLITLFPYLGFGMLIVFISVLLTSMGATIGISLGTMIVLSIVELIEQVKDYSIYHQMNYFYTNFISGFKWGSTFLDILIIMAYIAIPYIGSVLVLKNKDILS